ncbi:MAG: triple tyrosine motif-containing protein, partial [Ignavibacteriaceae bacterium]|nr:triple tyrosine motif-containing protein [Ignavibacteriaceae bacterium]
MNKNFFLSGINKFLVLVALLSAHLPAQFVEPKFDEVSPVLISDCVFQDSYGFIWIGDQGGLVKYNGYKLKRYAQVPFDSTSLSNNRVMAIKEDKNGNLWIGTWGGGLNYFDQRTENFTRFMIDKNNPKSITSNIIFEIIVNKDGSLLLGTMDQGLIYMKIDSNGIATYKNYDLNIIPNSKTRSGDNFVLDLYKDKQENIWIGTILGGLKLLDLSTGELTHFKHDSQNPNSISSNIVSSICEDVSGNLWIGTGHRMLTEGNGLNRFDPVTKQFTHYYHDPEDPSSLCSNNISSLLIDQEGILWIGTVDNKLNSIPISELLSNSNPKFTYYSDFDRSSVNSIDVDKFDNIWISFHGRTVYKFNRQQNPFLWYHHIEDNLNSLSQSSVTMVQEDRSGNIWFNTDGLERYDPVNGKFTHFKYDPDNPNGLSSPFVTSISEDKYGYYWIGTEKGINRLNPKTGVFNHIFSNPQDLSGNVISEVLISKSGDLWVSSPKTGLQLYNIEKNKFYSFDLDTTSTEDEGTGIYEDHTGILWCNTYTYGCFAVKIKDYKIESVKHYIHDPNNRNSLSCNLVEDIIRTRIIDTNAVWIATNIGLNRLDLKTETFTHFYVEDGLPSNFILKVLEDNDGNIWCACSNDIAVYNIKTGKISSYGAGDGMPFTGFGSRPQNACKTADGQLIFSGGSGSLGFYPDQLKQNMQIPTIYLTDFKIFHESVKLDTSIQFIKTIELPFDQNVFSFEFTALNFTNSEKNQYAYKLEGFYDDWIYIGHERVVSFTNIEPGEYVFRVKGSNNHGVWNETGASVMIIITPPWWASAWVYIFYAIVFLSIIYFTWKLQLKRIRIKHDYEMSKFESNKMHELDNLKSRFFANISHEFRTPLTLILGISKKILDKAKDQVFKDDIGIIKRNANRLNGLVNQLLDLSKLESGNMTLRTYPQNIIPLLKGLVLSFASFAERKRITLKFNSEEEEIVAYIDKDKVEKIVTNLLSNPFKFTPKGGRIEFGVKK